MRLILPAILFLSLIFKINAQAPPAIEWQKSIGGSGLESSRVLKITSDGGYILGGSTTSDDGDISGHKDSADMLILKLNSTGNIVWQKCYGGSGNDYVADILQTPDGGYIVVGSTSSFDGDVNGNHGLIDVWVIKISATGILQWQKCYGSMANDGYIFTKICPSTAGGYIVFTQVTGGDADVTGHHPASMFNENEDFWVFKIDATGNLLWQKCLGGTRTDVPGALISTTDGGYVIAGYTRSSNGDITCGVSGAEYFWMAKVDDAGNILWKKCQSMNCIPTEGRQTSDGGFIFTGGMNVSGKLGDAYVLKTDAAGNKQWEKNFGGSMNDLGQGITLTDDGGFVLAGHTSTSGEIICNFKGGYDLWLIKLNSSGEMEWQKTYGGSKPDQAASIVQTADKGFLVAGSTQSSDGDVSSIRGFTDIWLIKFSFPGIEFLPTINITASETNICSGKNVIFIATITEGGDMPSYQWKINGINTAVDNDTVIINTLNNGDIVSCTLTSNSPCVTSDTAVSNKILITIDPSLTPVNFLRADTVICDYGTLDLKATGNYKTYLWNNSSSAPVLIISQPGEYWLQVTTNKDCPGRDTIVVVGKECLKGFYMPTAFSPNGDGKNDVLKPILGGNIKQYKLIIMNRWGQVVFQTSDASKGWNGKLGNVNQGTHLFVWICTYQFEGKETITEKGTVLLIK